MASHRLELASRDRKELGERLALKVLNATSEPSPRKQLYGRIYSELALWDRVLFWQTIEEATDNAKRKFT